MSGEWVAPKPDEVQIDGDCAFIYGAREGVGPEPGFGPMFAIATGDYDSVPHATPKAAIILATALLAFAKRHGAIP